MSKNKDTVRSIDKMILAVKRIQNRFMRKKYRPENILLVFSHCLQFSKCPQKITNNLDECKRCGKCTVNDILALRDKFSILCAIATGGRAALELAKRESVKGIIAIACEQELSEGVRALLAKKVIPIPNKRPYGPCKDCGVDIASVETALKELLG